MSDDRPSSWTLCFVDPESGGLDRLLDMTYGRRGGIRGCRENREGDLVIALRETIRQGSSCKDPVTKDVFGFSVDEDLKSTKR